MKPGASTVPRSNRPLEPGVTEQRPDAGGASSWQADLHGGARAGGAAAVADTAAVERRATVR